MDFRIEWLKPALLDLKSQVQYLAENRGGEDALKHYERIHRATDSLQKLPARGRRCQRIPGYYELVLRPDYVIVYSVDEDEQLVRICAVIATKQDFFDAWKSQKRPLN